MKLLKCFIQYASKFEKLSSGHRTGKCEFSFQSQRWQCQRMFKHITALISPVSEWVSESCSVMSECLQSLGLYSPWNSPGQNTGVGSCSLLQGIFPTQGLNPCFAHCRRIIYQLSHQGSPMLIRLCSKSFKLSVSSTWTEHFQIHKLDLEKAEEPENKLPAFVGS